jgi:hypothetical protein
MDPITNFQAFWHHGRNVFGITVTTARHSGPLNVNSPEEFIALLAVLNGPSPVLLPDGRVMCGR